MGKAKAKVCADLCDRYYGNHVVPNYQQSPPLIFTILWRGKVCGFRHIWTAQLTSCIIIRYQGTLGAFAIVNRIAALTFLTPFSILCIIQTFFKKKKKLLALPISSGGGMAVLQEKLI